MGSAVPARKKALFRKNIFPQRPGKVKQAKSAARNRRFVRYLTPGREKRIKNRANPKETPHSKTPFIEETEITSKTAVAYNSHP